eukprot:NODE_13_length_42895_cov_0.518413.p6 type:complete len:585 gc:universal NODE_13_length_42895_cov_0.518413:13894-15648(+)
MNLLKKIKLGLDRMKDRVMEMMNCRKTRVEEEGIISKKECISHGAAVDAFAGDCRPVFARISPKNPKLIMKSTNNRWKTKRVTEGSTLTEFSTYIIADYELKKDRNSVSRSSPYKNANAAESTKFGAIGISIEPEKHENDTELHFSLVNTSIVDNNKSFEVRSLDPGVTNEKVSGLLNISDHSENIVLAYDNHYFRKVDSRNLACEETILHNSVVNCLFLSKQSESMDSLVEKYLHMGYKESIKSFCFTVPIEMERFSSTKLLFPCATNKSAISDSFPFCRENTEMVESNDINKQEPVEMPKGFGFSTISNTHSAFPPLLKKMNSNEEFKFSKEQLADELFLPALVHPGNKAVHKKNWGDDLGESILRCPNNNEKSRVLENLKGENCDLLNLNEVKSEDSLGYVLDAEGLSIEIEPRSELEPNASNKICCQPVKQYVRSALRYSIFVNSDRAREEEICPKVEVRSLKISKFNLPPLRTRNEFFESGSKGSTIKEPHRLENSSHTDRAPEFFPLHLYNYTAVKTKYTDMGLLQNCLLNAFCLQMESHKLDEDNLALRGICFRNLAYSLMVMEEESTPLVMDDYYT